MSEIVVYGKDDDKDGPVFDRRCPKCSRFMAFPKELNYRVRWIDEMCEFPKVDCKRCGPVEPVHIGWAGDYR